ncbi:MAG: hypothetical protein JXA53_11735 [Bacteroidales bacterium]|nr:hypothetical protein [Bacteroidales bacterium]
MKIKNNNNTTAGEILWIVVTVILFVVTIQTILKNDFKRTITFSILMVVSAFMYYLRRKIKTKN